MTYILESKLHSLVSHISYSEDSGWGLDFLKGFLVNIPQDRSGLFVEAESERVELPDYFEVDGVPIVRKKFIDTIELAGVDNFQALPVEVRFENGADKGYFLLNVIGRVKCFDETKTDCTKFGPSIARIFSLKLADNPAHGAYMFRAHEYQDVIFITEQVKHEIEKANITGCEIRSADGWSDAHRF